MRRTVIENKYIPDELEGFQFPSVAQAYFLTLPVKEALYGGAAGGGKSAALLAAALQYVHIPGYSAILFRRTLTDLEQARALIPMSHSWLNGTDAKWDGSTYQWLFPSGATVSFGYLKDAMDHMRYKGAWFQTVGFDELTSFKESPYLFLFGRLRKPPGMPVPLRCLSASNPGDIGHEWVKTRFSPHLPAQHHSPGRVFVPARLEENPGIDAVSYEEMLAELDPVTRAQMRHGDWDTRPEGNLFKREWFDKKFLDETPRDIIRRVRYWDLAATDDTGSNDPDYTAGVLMGMTRDREFVVLDAQEFRATPAKRDALVRSKAEEDGRGVEVHVEQEPGSSGKSQIDYYRRTVLPGFAVYGDKVTGDKITRAKPFSAACQNGLVKLVRGSWVGRFLDNLVSFGQPGAHDDVTDAAGGAHRKLTSNNEAWDEAAMRNAFDGPAEDLDAPAEGEKADPFVRMLNRLRGEEL